MEQPHIIIEGDIYEHVKRRFAVDVSVYKNTAKNWFMRLGDPELISREYDHHMFLEKYNFPVASIVKKGIYGDQCYYTETSLGDELLSFALTKNKEENAGTLSEETLNRVALLLEKYVESQLSTKSYQKTGCQLLDSTVSEYLSELPSMEKTIIQARHRYHEYFTNQPLVFSHGDFNTHNLFWDGVIDVEGFTWMPFGYDVVTFLYNGYYFPEGEHFEMRRAFVFSPKEREFLIQKIDSIATRYDLPKYHTYVDHHLTLRTLWAAMGMSDMPILQNWRYTLVEEVLDAYVTGKSVVNVVDTYTA